MDIALKNKKTASGQLDEKFLTTAVFIITLGINLLMVYYHESWRDEAQAWLIARDCSLKEFPKVLSNEGHFFLWFAILMPFAKLGFPYWTTKLISTAFCSLGTWVFLKKSPFSLYTRIAIAFSPCCLYDWPAVSRCYCLILPLIAYLAVFYKDRLIHPVKYGILLALLMQTHIIMAGFVFGASCEWLYTAVSYAVRKKTEIKEFSLAKNAAGLVAVLASAVLALLELAGVAASSVISTGGTNEKIYTAGELISLFWNDFLLQIEKMCNSTELTACIVLFLICVITALTVMAAGKNAAGPMVAGTIGILWMVFVSAMVYRSIPQRAICVGVVMLWQLWVVLNSKEIEKTRKAEINIATALALCIAICGFTEWIAADIQYQYSDSQEIAEVINSLPDNAVVIETSEDFCNAVTPYLDKDIVYSPLSHQIASYCSRGEDSTDAIPLAEFEEYCESFGAAEVYLLDCPNNTQDETRSELLPLLDKCIVVYSTVKNEGFNIEHFVLYKYTKSN